MGISLLSVYRRLPVVRELRSVQQLLMQLLAEINGLQRSRKLLEATAMIQALESIKSSDPRYQDRRRLLIHGAQGWSQNYEDGMIAEIFYRVPPTTKSFLEIGVGDGSENNTTALLAQGWRGWWLEGSPDNCASIQARLATMPSLTNRLKVRQALVSPENIKNLLNELGIPREVDLFSLDIDLDTYHIWRALPEFRPRVVVVEYNAAIGPSQSWIHPYKSNRMWDGTQAFGASLKAFELLGRTYGYSLVGCDITGINAFFVRDDLVDDQFIAPFTSENHYEPPRYHLWFRWGHPSTLFGESHGVANERDN
jgi:hypothetical protein